VAVIQLIVSGTRKTWGQFAIRVWAELEEVHALTPISLIIEGGATGVDRFARTWAKERGVEFVTVDADWKRHGRAAGMIRNREMLLRYPQAGLLAFPHGESRGTRGCIALAEQLGRVVRVVEL